MKNIMKLLLTVIFTTIINTFIICLYNYNINPEVKNVRILNYDKEKSLITLEVEKNESIILYYDFECKIKIDNEEYKSVLINDKCRFELPLKSNYLVSIENNNIKSKEVNALDYIDNKYDFKFNEDKIYLAIDEKQIISYTEDYIIPIDMIFDFYTEDESIAKVENGYVIGLKPGKTKLRVKDLKEEIEIIVTDLITKPTLSLTKKEIVPCKTYSEEDAKLLDELLYYYISKAGDKTRAGAVAAGRFLTLQFKYRVPYFYENGRISDSGVHKADGEGRYYKRGLYLAESKYENILYKYAGPAMWGCPLKNGQNNPKYGFRAGNKMPNGLDCSGFVSWALVNGGFDPGDVGAGQNEGIYQLTDTGEFTTLTKDLALSGEIKTGDLFNFWGHIALIIGQDEDNYYVAESLPHLGGVIAKSYSKKTVASHFEFVVLMDSFYKEDGNLTDYWE